MLAAAALQSFNPNFLVSNATLQHLVNDFSQFLLILWYKLCINSVFQLVYWCADTGEISISGSRLTVVYQSLFDDIQFLTELLNANLHAIGLFHLEMCYLSLQVLSSSVEVNKPFQCRLRFQNPLNTILRNCSISVDGPGIDGEFDQRIRSELTLSFKYSANDSI